MKHSIDLGRRCMALPIAGAVPQGAQILPAPAESDIFAICPDDYAGVQPKLEVKEGDAIAMGAPLIHDKNDNNVKIVSPVAGTVHAVVRGDRRKILRVEVKAGAEQSAATNAYPTDATADNVKQWLAATGLLAHIRRRPYDIVARVADSVRDVFVTAIDSAPLAYSQASLVADKQAELTAGVKALRAVTAGAVYVAVADGSPLGAIEQAEMITVKGSHPAGNVGVHIANVKPINKGEVVWALDIATLCKIGHACLTGQYDGSTVVAITGPEVKEPRLIATHEGAQIAPLLTGNVKGDHVRIISGNVLTGIAVDDYLRFPYQQITVIAEGDQTDEFMGWARPLHAEPAPDTRLRGGRRAMILSGQYDKYMPMDILPEYLLKAIIGRDIERMEALGIYEVAPEDFALAEYADASKMPLQQIVRQGLDWLRNELE